MKLHKLLLPVILVLMISPAFSLAAKRIVTPNNPELQPIPVNTLPDISHNVNAVHTSIGAVNAIGDVNSTAATNPSSSNTPDAPMAFLLKLKTINGSSSFISWLLIAGAIIVALLVIGLVIFIFYPVK
jgi:hypothetical protein